MKFLSPHEAARYRRIHRIICFVPLAAFLLAILVANTAPDGDSKLRVAALITAAIAALFGAVAVPVFQYWLINYIEPDPELRGKIVKLSWSIRPFGGYWAVGELLDQSVLRGGSLPLWQTKKKRKSQHGQSNSA